MDGAQRNGRGRPSKGDRHTFVTRVPREAADLIQAEADRLGLYYGEYIAYVVSNAHGVSMQLPTKHDTEQTELPLGKSA